MTATPYLDFVVLCVSDIEASLEYYLKLGFTLFEEGSGPDFKQLKGSEGSVQLGLAQASSDIGPAGTTKLYFKTHDMSLEEWRSTLLNKGVEVSPIAHPPFGSIFNVPSEDGHHLIMMVDAA